MKKSKHLFLSLLAMFGTVWVTRLTSVEPRSEQVQWQKAAEVSLAQFVYDIVAGSEFHKGEVLTPSPQPTAKPASKDITRSPKSATILRFSDRGGCYNTGDFYFEMRSTRTGAEWLALLCYHPLNLIEIDGVEPLPRGNYYARGTLGPEAAQAFFHGLEAAQVHHIEERFSGTGPWQALMFKSGEPEIKLPGFQVPFQEGPHPNGFLLAYLREGLPGRIETRLQQRGDTRQTPDASLVWPNEDWLDQGLGEHWVVAR